MNPAVPPLPNKDDEHLKILSIFHYVMAGLLAPTIFVLIAQFLMLDSLMTNPGFWGGNADPPPQEALGIIRAFFVVTGFFILLIVVLNILCARDLRTNNNRTLSLIVSGVNCLNFPLGTTLGVFTLIVLMRPSVIQRYQFKQPY
ncbi:MAG: hypothetical protein ACSHYB_18520 [Roseibacillus sp.]